MGITGLLPLLKDTTCDVQLRSFSGKVAAIDVYCWLNKTVCFLWRRDWFCDRSNAVRINTSFLHVPKVLDFEHKLLFSALLTTDFFSGTLTCAWRILIFSSKIMCNLFWFSRRSWRARQMWNPPPLTCCCWGQQQVNEGFLVIFY